MIFLMLLKKSVAQTDLSKNGLENALDSCVFTENLVFLGQAEIPIFQSCVVQNSPKNCQKCQMINKCFEIVWEQ